MLAAAGNSKALWYATRATGMVSLVLLTLSVALGIAQTVRYASPRWPRFVVAALHRNASLLAVAFLAVHITTAVADSFAPIRLIDVFVPFVGAYRPLWLGLGTVAFDLLLALVITSLLRERIGYGAWRAVHWAAYAAWPVALLHGLGTGSDTRARWAVFVNVACLAAVLAAVLTRVGWTRAASGGRRALAAFGSVAVAFAVSAWMILEPMRPGWARKAGTPSALVAHGIGPRRPARARGRGRRVDTDPLHEHDAGHDPAEQQQRRHRHGHDRGPVAVGSGRPPARHHRGDAGGGRRCADAERQRGARRRRQPRPLPRQRREPRRHQRVWRRCAARTARRSRSR